VVHYEQAGKRRGASSPGSAATVSEILGYWKRSAEVGDGCIEISAHSSEVELK